MPSPPAKVHGGQAEVRAVVSARRIIGLRVRAFPSSKYIEGTIAFGEVVQAAAAFVVVQGAFNRVTDGYGRIAEWTASADRVASLLLALDQIDGQTSPDVIAGADRKRVRRGRRHADSD